VEFDLVQVDLHQGGFRIKFLLERLRLLAIHVFLEVLCVVYIIVSNTIIVIARIIVIVFDNVVRNGSIRMQLIQAKGVCRGHPILDEGIAGVLG